MFRYGELSDNTKQIKDFLGEGYGVEAGDAFPRGRDERVEWNKKRGNH